MRPVTLYQKPPFPPYVCISCGVGEPPRKWFIDIGLSLDYHFNPVNDGTIFFCDECWNNVRVQTERCINNWVYENEAWDSPDRVAASFKWKDDLEKVTPNDVRGSESGITEPVATGELSTGTGTDSSSERDSESTEFIDADDEPDDESKAAFTAIFGEPPEPG